MKKSKIYNIWKDFWINNQNIEKIILKNTKLSKSQLFLTDEINNDDEVDIIADFNKLKKWEPIEYILWNAKFYSLDFFVDKRVLIPRNDTEIMVDKAIEVLVKLDHSTLIDIWTGSGCIAISILKNTQKIKHCYITDISRNILELTKKNVSKHSLDKKILILKSNLLIKFLWNNDYHLSNNIIITANLPYIKNWDYGNMSIETIKYEPDLALYGGKNTGFELYETLIKECFLLKKLNNLKNIYLFIEIWFDQYEYSKKYLETKWLNSKYYEDNNGIKRCIKIEF